MKAEARPNLLLHCCCGPCSTAVIERLAGEYNMTLYFFNPNITDSEEYEKRKASLLKFLVAYNDSIGIEEKVRFLEGPYDAHVFYDWIKGLEEEPEGGKRCEKCFELRLSATAEKARKMGLECFSTTLSISPHKSYPLISGIGADQSLNFGIHYLDGDFKKKAGFERSLQLSKKHGLYRQNYCGCEFSKKLER